MGLIKKWRQAELIKATAEDLINNMDKACQFVAGQAQAKAPARTGKLRNQIGYKVEAEGTAITGYVGVKKEAFYGYFLELGTSKMAARPFLRPAVYQNSAQIVKILASKG